VCALERIHRGTETVNVEEAGELLRLAPIAGETILHLRSSPSSSIFLCFPYFLSGNSKIKGFQNPKSGVE
jgi:hypothetical protein